MSSSDRTKHQPIDPSVLPLMDPQYVKFHNEHVIYMPKTEDTPYSPSIRAAASKGLMPGSSHIRKVAKTEEFVIGLENIKVRAWTPLGEVPAEGWPVLLWFHGGGWVLGGLDSENHICTAMTQDAKCVTITVDYRLAPEHPWPAAVHDAVNALQWVVGEGCTKLNLNSSRIATGGFSAGGNLSAILCNRAPKLSPPIKISFQLLNTPVVDSSIKEYTINTNAPWLSPDRMMWYRRLYLPNEADWSHPEASPYYAPDSEIALVPKTFIAVAGQDILAPEALKYAEKLKSLVKGTRLLSSLTDSESKQKGSNGVIRRRRKTTKRTKVKRRGGAAREGKREAAEVETWVVEGATHSVMNLEDVMDSAKDLIRREAEALNEGFQS
ncbi:BZ3500_MvSof-1268-A1-R1_Chr9g10605 [Microbotryum saponariae]|uniref:BZ3500_MvSof-1268-A1-R1_Chr9g10605 protein n=1 Tax=Microbotryum saponariae TaxID=289078 RepID=A0A2X0KBT0_9BASI|nr:BZ3501_MvSof-1269-A2-R1_Chr9g10353 [Microbotryum saponariae]SDA00375.1 BZ3500_MvSof-1268-A1-R1_Chr9g10605 [Microbotryum saponariae]